MPRVNNFYVQAFQFFDAGLRCRPIVHDRIERGLLGVVEQVADKQIAVGSQNTDRAAGMAGN